VVVTAAVWATCTKQQAVYKEATREGGLFCLGCSSLLSLAGRLCPSISTHANVCRRPQICHPACLGVPWDPGQFSAIAVQISE
jgi:hypothetical protein